MKTHKTILISFISIMLFTTLSLATNDNFPGEYDLVQTDSLPILIKEVVPIYPETSLENNISGIIDMKALIDTAGNVVQAKVKYPNKEYSELETESVNSALLCKYNPAIYKNKPVAYWLSYKVQFSILDPISKKTNVQIVGVRSPNESSDPEIYPEPDEFIPVEVYPEMIHQVQTDYPEKEKQAGITGDVYVKVLVNIEGNVIKSMIAKSCGTVSLDKSAVDASYKNIFKPGIKDGRPVAVWVSYKVSFTLKE